MPMADAYIGLYRLQNTHAAAVAAAESGGHILPPSFVAVRATGTGDFHASLRRIDASQVTSRFGSYQFGDRSKCIVLDFSTAEALTTVLRQVKQSPASLVFCHVSVVITKKLSLERNIVSTKRC